MTRAILAQNGITLGEDDNAKPRPAVRDCPRCNLINNFDNKYCSKCSYPLVPDAYEEIKTQEDGRFKALEQKYDADIALLKEAMNDMQLLLRNREKLI
ncbi:MAG: hypothetical protein WA364_17915 [Candidatus Nitrosopolaris sp.]